MTQAAETRIETYMPLYRKYRPQAFADVVGQEAIVQTLGNAIRLNKVAHAYLFCGPRGTGKTSTARIFAKSLNCEQGPTVTPCMQCAACAGITQGNALDVVEFDAASNNGVGDARELIENVQYSAMTGRFKVYIIDEVHMLTTQAFNALLKTLEEPPPNVIFIFATTEAHKVLPTIISRCQRFDFNRITAPGIVSRLAFIADQENIAIDEEALAMIARHARGGLRDAVGLLDQVSVLGRAQPGAVVSRQDVALFIGTLEEELLLRLGQAIAERRAADLLQELGELLNRGVEPIQLLKDLTLHFRNLLVAQAAGADANPDALGLPPDYHRQLLAQAALFPAVEEIPQLVGRLASVERNVRHSSQPYLWLEVGLIELAYRHEIHLVQALSERLAQVEAQLAGQSVASVAAVRQPGPPLPPSMPLPQAAPSVSALPSGQATPAPVSEQAAMVAPPSPRALPPQPAPISQAAGGHDASLEGLYAKVCAAIPSRLFRSVLEQQTFPISLENDLLTLGCSSEAHLATVKKADKLVHLQKAVDAAFGRSLRLEVVLEKKRSVASALASPPLGQSAQSVLPAESLAPALPPTPLALTLNAPPPALPLSPAAPALSSGPPSMDELPPMDLGSDSPPPEEEEDDTFSSLPPTPVAATTVATLGADQALNESKKHAMELLQGRMLD